MPEMKQGQKRIMLIAGGALVLYLLYRYYQGQAANTNANQAGAPADASAQYAALAGQEQSDVAALQQQEQSDVANLLAANTQLGATLANAFTAFETQLQKQQNAWIKAEEKRLKELAMGHRQPNRGPRDKPGKITGGITQIASGFGKGGKNMRGPDQMVHGVTGGIRQRAGKAFGSKNPRRGGGHDTPKTKKKKWN